MKTLLAIIVLLVSFSANASCTDPAGSFNKPFPAPFAVCPTDRLRFVNPQGVQSGLLRILDIVLIDYPMPPPGFDNAYPYILRNGAEFASSVNDMCVFEGSNMVRYIGWFPFNLDGVTWRDGFIDIIFEPYVELPIDPACIFSDGFEG